jgi:hypothetical protein
MSMAQIKRGNKGEQVEQLQKHVNSTLNKAELDWMKMKVDGVAGPITFRCARIAAAWQGLSTEQLKAIAAGTIDDHVFEILTGQKPRTEEMKKRSEDRRKNFARMREEHRNPPIDADGVGEWRGFQVAAWMVGGAVGPDGKQVNWLQKSVEEGWDGDLNSGWRSPERSEEICFEMCGAATCSGKCGGRTSNHSQIGPPNWGAIDVQDFTRFGEIQRRIGSPLKNALPEDLVHYSFTGR